MAALTTPGVNAPLAAGQLPPDTLVSGPHRVLFWPGDSVQAARTIAQLGRMTPFPGLPPDLPTYAEVILAPDEARFRLLAGGPLSTWEAGLARPDIGQILMPSYASARTRFGDPGVTLRHEMAHLALGEHLRSLRVPRWFHEGYAGWASGSWDASEGWQLRTALALGRAQTLDSLELAWPADPAGAQLAYLLSATAVEYLAQGSGERGMRLFLTRWKELESFEEALRRTYGVTSSQLEEDWKGYVKRRYGWLLTLSHAVVFWIVLGVVVLAAFWLRRRQRRQKMAQLRAGEPPESPAYWKLPPALPPRPSAENQNPTLGYDPPPRSAD